MTTRRLIASCLTAALLASPVWGCGGREAELPETATSTDTTDTADTTEAQPAAAPFSALRSGILGVVPSAPTHPKPTPNDCIQDVTAGKRSYSCEGLTFEVTVPTSCITTPCGLVVDVHGLTMSGAMEDNNTTISALGRKHGYVVVQPNSPGTPPFASWSAADDDVVYHFMLRAITAWHLDTRRVHFTGFSQGGQMTWRFLNKYGAALASAAPAGFCIGWSGLPKVKIPLLYMQGTKDSVVQAVCGTAEQGVLGRLKQPWQLDAGQIVAQGQGYRRTRHTGADGALLELLTHDYKAGSPILQGHCYPGSKDLKPAVKGQLFGFGCQGTSPVHWGQAAMKFFIAHPKS